MSHKGRGLWRTGGYCFGSQGERSPILKGFYWLVQFSERSYWLSFISERFYWLVLLNSCGNSIQLLAAPSSPTKRAEFRRISLNSLPHLITLPVTRSICLRYSSSKETEALGDQSRESQDVCMEDSETRRTDVLTYKAQYSSAAKGSGTEGEKAGIFYSFSL